MAGISLSLEDGAFVARSGRKQTELTYEQAFALGHSLLDDAEFGDAEGIFKVLARVRGRGPRAKLMLSRCKAGRFNLDACEEILQSVFDGENEAVAEELQAAFTYHVLDARESAIRELVKVVNEHPDLPTACLFLGDLLKEAGRYDKAAKCWKLAIRRDRRGGAVSVAARKELTKLDNRRKKVRKSSGAKKKVRAKKLKSKRGPTGKKGPARRRRDRSEMKK